MANTEPTKGDVKLNVTAPPLPEIAADSVSQSFARGLISKYAYDGIMERKVVLLQESKLVANAALLPRYPPLILVPDALVDANQGIVVGSSVELIQQGKNLYQVVQFSGPYLLFLNRILTRGILAHELIHYIRNTIELFRTRRQSRVTLHDFAETQLKGLAAHQRHELVYEDPKSWFTNNRIREAVSLADSSQYKRSQTANKVLSLAISGKVPTKSYSIGKIVEFEGDVEFEFTEVEESILSRARQMRRV